MSTRRTLPNGTATTSVQQYQSRCSTGVPSEGSPSPIAVELQPSHRASQTSASTHYPLPTVPTNREHHSELTWAAMLSSMTPRHRSPRTSDQYYTGYDKHP